MTADVKGHYHMCNLAECAEFGIPADEIISQRANALRRASELADPLNDYMQPTPLEYSFLCTEHQNGDKSWCPTPRNGLIKSHSCVRMWPHDEQSHLCQCGHEWSTSDN